MMSKHCVPLLASARDVDVEAAVFTHMRAYNLCAAHCCREACLARGCVWCADEIGIPWCFEDNSVNMGGEMCPSDIPNVERVDCFPAVGVTREKCLNKVSRLLRFHRGA